MVTNAFLRQLPKAELHVHIEGTFEPELVFEIARRNGVRLSYGSAEELRAAYQFADLQSFLDVYYEGMAALLRERDFHDLTLAYLERAHGDGVVHVEMFFDPQAHTARGVDFDVVLEGISTALAQGEKRFGITSKLIMCFCGISTRRMRFARWTWRWAIATESSAWGSIRRKPDTRRANSSACSGRHGRRGF